MNQLWLMTMIALLAVNVIAQDDSDEHFLNMVRRKACAGRSCGDTNARRTDDLSEDDENMDDSSHEAGDDDLDTKDTSFMDTRKRMSNRQPALNKRMQAPASTGEDIKKELSSRQCKTLRCRLRYAFESDKDGNQEWDVNKDDQGADEPRKRCVSWNCKRRFLINREKILSKKSQVANNKRCMSWGCRKRSLKVFMRDRTTTPNLQRQERSDVKRNVQSKKCMTRECKKEQELSTANLKKKASTKCMAWYCKDGKRAMKRSGGIDASKRIISRKPDDVLGLFDLSRDGKCRGLECLTKRMSKDRNADVASLSRKNKMSPGCITWDCYGKRTVAKKEPAAIDTLKRIISRKNDKDLDLPGLSNEKCRGWECLKKRVVHVVQNDIPIVCLSWDCDKRRADTGETTLGKQARSTKTQENVNEQFDEKDVTQYGTPDEYKDMIQMPIRRGVLGRLSPYITDRGSRRTLGKDIQEK